MSKVAKAYERAKPIRDVLHQTGRCMEVTEDKRYGILWERWLVGTTSLLLMATEHAVIVAPEIADQTWTGTIEAVKQLAA